MNGVMVAVDRVRSLAGGPRSGFECVAQPHPDDVGLRVAGEGLPQWIFLQRNVANLQRLEVHTPRECACRRGTFHFPQHSPTFSANTSISGSFVMGKFSLYFEQETFVILWGLWV